MMSELKPCPFCGCKMYIVREGVRVAAEGGHDADCIMLGIVESYSNVAVLVKGGCGHRSNINSPFIGAFLCLYA